MTALEARHFGGLTSKSRPSRTSGLLRVPWTAGQPSLANDWTWQNSLANRFVTYRLYWTDTQMRFTVIDNGVEHDMYNAPRRRRPIRRARRIGFGHAMCGDCTNSPG